MSRLIETSQKTKDGRTFWFDPESGIAYDLEKPPVDYKIIGIAENNPKNILVTRDNEEIAFGIPPESLDITPEAMEYLRKLFNPSLETTV